MGFLEFSLNLNKIKISKALNIRTTLCCASVFVCFMCVDNLSLLLAVTIYSIYCRWHFLF